MGRKRQGVIGALVGVVWVVLGPGCRQVAAIHDAEPPPACAAAVKSAPKACGTCLVDACCAEIDACMADAGCKSLLACVSACTDDACLRACEKKGFPESAAAVLACRARCECGSPCGGAGPPFAGCQPCGGTCCEAGTTLARNVSAQRLRSCRTRCAANDAACFEGCVQSHPEGADLERAALSCAARECDVDEDWSCVGHVERPPAASSFAFVFNAFDQFTHLPLSGVLLTACSPDIIERCVPRSNTVHTNETGTATVTITTSGGDDGYGGPFEISAPGYGLILLYHAPPLFGPTQAGLAMVRLDELKGPAVPLPSGERGMLFVNVTSCAGAPARGVTIRASTTDPAAKPFYVKLGEGSTFDTELQRTTAAGVGGIANLRPGPTTLSLAVDPLCLPTSRANVGIRTNAITVVIMGPTP